VTDGSDKPLDLYRPKRKQEEKVEQNINIDDWDKIDYELEFVKVNGDPRETGELSKQEKNKIEMMKAYRQDPVGMEAAMKQAQQMKALKKATQQQPTGTAPSPAERQAKQRAEHQAKLQETLKKTGMAGHVFSGDDLKTPEGMAKLNQAVASQAK